MDEAGARLTALQQGIRAMGPILIGVVPFGLVVGVAGAKAGMGAAGSLLMSVIVLAGASQLAAMELFARQAPLVIVVGTGLIINLRFFMYSASLAPQFASRPLGTKALLAYLLTDQAYALSINRFRGGYPDALKPWFYVGAGTTLLAVYCVFTVVGGLIGAGLPPGLNLEFAIPLTFMALLVPVVRDSSDLVAAVVSASVAVACFRLPYNLWIMAGAVSGIAAGFVAGKRAQ